MGKGKRAATEAQGPAMAAPSLDWGSKAGAKRRKKGKYTWVLWALGPLLAAGAVAYLLGPQEPPPPTVGAREAEVSAPPKKQGAPATMEAPPLDTHNASECAAWAGDGQCEVRRCSARQPLPQAVATCHR